MKKNIFRKTIQNINGFEPLKFTKIYLINVDKGQLVHYKRRKLLGIQALNGYVLVTIFNRSKYLHRLVWEHVVGPIPNNCEIDHKDGNKRNNSIDNLQCLTIKEHRSVTGERTKAKNREKRKLINKLQEELNIEGLDEIEDFNLKGLAIHYQEEGETNIANCLKSHVKD